MAELRIDELYEAVLDEERFASLPSILAEMRGAGRPSINAYAGDGCDILSCSNFAPDVLQVIIEEETGPSAVLERTQFYNDLRPFGVDEQTTLTAAVRHVHAGIKVRALLSRERRMNDMRAAALAAFSLGVILVKADGRLLDFNAAAEAVLQADDGLRVRRGVLTASSASCAARLAHLIADATAPAMLRSGALRLDRDTGHWLLTVVPLKDGRPPNKALVLVQDSQPRSGGSPARLRALFGLTPAEADVALLLAGGMSLAEAAEARQVSIGTVRSQVKAISAKLGVSRQAELTAVIASLPKLRD